MIVNSIELYPVENWIGLQSIFSKNVVCILDLGKYTLRTVGSELVAETQPEPSERQNPFHLLINLLYGPSSDTSKEMRGLPITMSLGQLAQFSDWALNATSTVEEIYAIIINIKIKTTSQEYRYITGGKLGENW